MMHDAPERASFPVSPENTPTKRRAVFSASFAGLTSHHVQPDIVTSTSRRRRNLDDDSLRLIDDLTNRPMDVMYTDSRLATKNSVIVFGLVHPGFGIPYLHCRRHGGKRVRPTAEYRST